MTEKTNVFMRWTFSKIEKMDIGLKILPVSFIEDYVRILLVIY
jgi:hypothetical protein